MKRMICYSVLLLSFCLFFTGCVPKQKNFSAMYFSGAGGTINGDSIQTASFGEDFTSVTAIPKEGFLFSGWSDGIMSEQRQDKNVQSDISVSANFVSKTKTLKFQYNGATINATQPNVTIHYDRIQDASFIIPQKTSYAFDGWYLDPEFTVKATDESGFYYNGRSIFFSSSDTLYAKWISKASRNYKLLLIFVEETRAQLETVENEQINVNHKMSLVERKTCELIAPQLEHCLNDWFEGSVVFEVDSYFTSDIAGQNAFSSGLASNGMFSYHIFANNLPEVGPILKNYRSVIVTFGMNDNDYKLHDSAGSAGMKYAAIHMEGLFRSRIANSMPLETILDPSYQYWKEEVLDSFLHEFTHTIEIGINVFEYHEIFKYYNPIMPTIEATKLYLLNRAIINGESVGIPYDYWIGNIEVLVNYIPQTYEMQNAGKIVLIPESQPDLSDGKNYVYQTIPYGSSLTVKAIPYNGYKFVRWSDGVTTAQRTDRNVISYINVEAIFEKI